MQHSADPMLRRPQALRLQNHNGPQAFLEGAQKIAAPHKVRSFQDKSLVLDDVGTDRKRIYSLADQLEINDPMYHVWRMKHDNKGLLIFERPQDFDAGQEHFLRFLYMLSFCPIF